MRNYKRWKRIVVMGLMSIAMAVTALPVYAAAPDWSQVEGSDMDTPHSNLQKMQSAYDEENLYIHITGGESETWDQLPQVQLVINQKSLEGSRSTLKIIQYQIPAEGETTVSVKDAYEATEIATGTLVRHNKRNEIDIAIPFIGLGYIGKDVSEVKVIGAIAGNKIGETEAVYVGTPVDPEQPPTEPEKKDIVIDGDFSDWSGYELAYINSKGASMASMTCDGTNLFLRIIENGSLDNRFQWNSGEITILSNMGQVLRLKAQVSGTAEKAELTFEGIDGAYGKCGRSEGVYNWEICIPLSAVWSGIIHIEEISMVLTENPNTPIITIKNPSYMEGGSGDSGDSGDGNDGDLEVGSGIVIDGYYRDWENIPHIELTHGGNEKANNHIGAITMGEDAVYVHYKLGKLYEKAIRLDYMEFMINGVSYDLRILPVDENGNIVKDIKIEDLAAGTYTNFGIFLSDNSGRINNEKVGGSMALKIYEVPRTEQSPGDEVEFSISYERLEALTGLKATELRDVKIRNNSIGEQWITCVGTSSGPWLGIAISVAAAVVLYYILAGKKRRKEG